MAARRNDSPSRPGGEMCRSTRRRFDLADAIMLRAQTAQKTVTLSIHFANQEAGVDQEMLEGIIRYDLGFDGYGVTLSRQPPKDPDAAFEWKLRVRPH